MKKLLALLLLLTIYYLLFTIPSPAHAVGICPGPIEEDHSGDCCDWGNKDTNTDHIGSGDPGCDTCYMGNFDNPQHTKPFGPCKYCHADVCVYGSGCEQTCNKACCAGADSFCTEELPRSDVEKGPTRPYPCNICLEAMPEPISLFCADQLQPQDVITYLENEGNPDPPHTVIKTWGGPIEVDLTNTEMPLVGKAQLNIADKELEDQTRVQEYLADYFEGTAFYDQEPVDLETEDLEKLREETRRILTYGGVFRKLAPKELQDKLRENMVMRAKGEEPRWPGATDIVHNYIVVYVKEEEIVSPGEPDSEEIRLLDFLDYLRPMREDDETDEEYDKAVGDWEKEEIKGVKLPLLWAYVPMFSREDVPGRVDLELEKEHDNDSLTITSSEENQKIYLPHLARLNEVSDWVYQIFHTLAEKLTSWKGPLIAQPKNLPNTDSRVLSASNQDFGTCDHEDDALWNPGDKICGQPITAELSATEEFENTNYRQPSPPTPPPVPCGECVDATECPLGYSCMNTCCVPPAQPKVYTKDVSRKIDVLVRIPFLDDLWEKIVAGKEEDGSILQSIFRIFFPHEELEFDDYDYPGMGSLTYKYKGSTEFVKAGDDKKGHEAKIYYDHLGGIRCIRDKVLERLLPAETEFVPFCAAMPMPVPSPEPMPPGFIAGGCGVCGAPIKSETLVRYFGEAGSFFNVPGSVLAGVAHFEGWHLGAPHLFDYTDLMVRQDSQPGAKDRNCAISYVGTTYVGAKGPMQFMDNQWDIYKNAAIEAGVREEGYEPEVCNILDAIYAAAKKLRHDVETFGDGTNCECGQGQSDYISLSSPECATPPAPSDCNWEKGDVFHATCHYYGNCTSNYCATCWQFYQNYSCGEEYDELKQSIIDQFAGRIPQEWCENVTGVKKRLDTSDRVIALTFDACGGSGGSGYDVGLIDYLIANNIPATLFINARWIDANLDIFQQLANNPLFDIANHGTQHKPCSVNGRSAYGIPGTNSVGEVYDEIEQNARKIEQLTGRKPRYYRSGTACYDEVCVEIAESLGYQVIGFNINGDEGATLSQDRVKDAMLGSTPGSIIIQHMNHPEGQTAEGVREAIPLLIENGYNFVKLSNYGLK